MATHSDQLKSRLATRFQGGAIVLYFALLPYVVITKWRTAATVDHGAFLRILLIVLAIFWLGFLAQVLVNVRRLKRGGLARGGGSAWLAGLLIALLAFLIPGSSGTLRTPAPITATLKTTSPTVPHRSGRLPSPLTSAGAVPLALMAKRRGDSLRDLDESDPEFDVDESIRLLRERSPELLATIHHRAGEAVSGVLDLPDNADLVEPAGPVTPMAACHVGPSVTGTLVSFAREGGQLAVPPSWSVDDIVTNVVALHEGRVLFARGESDLLRALATRALRHSVVVYLGAANDLDTELAACSITLKPLPVTAPLSDSGHPLIGNETVQPNAIRVELLRADPQVFGLAEPFAATLRRRCVEMVAYLALHRHEPITGERLRTRVLTNADVDASLRTLSNTASAVRRSLGIDGDGPRLHPVTSSGLYVTHGVTSDIEVFTNLIHRARQLPINDATPLAHEALLLIKGEPLASALRGFEWFLAEGHGARLARDGEWAALALHHSALQKRNYELAFWALQQGLLIDPYSDALGEALARVPRLREFGGNRPRASQHRPVSTSDAVAMSWAFARFSQQITK